MSALGPHSVMKDLTGAQVGRFLIRARIGAGGMGEVYRAEDTKLKREVALKRLARHLRGDERYHRAFLREAEQASQLNCPYVAAIYDVLDENGEMFLVMEYVEGVNLRHRTDEPMPLEEFLRISVQCAEGLAAAHDKGIVHRDIKPENIMVSTAGQVKMLDFGLAKRLNFNASGMSETQSGGFVGTPGYMAPEVLLEAKPDERADIFSLGLVFYEIVTGQHPFQTPALIRTADRILHDDVPPLHQMNPTLPASLELILGHMLAKKPEQRYANAHELAEDLKRLQQQTVSGTRLKRVQPRRRWLAPALYAVTLVVIAAGLLAVPNIRKWILGGTSVTQQGTRYIAVLPFRAIGTEQNDQVFSDGLTETITAKLTQMASPHGLQVAPASEVFTRKLDSADAARKQLGVNLVLDGSVHRVGDAVRINYELIDASTGRQLRADTITANSNQAFDLEDRVVAGIVGMLEVELQPAERQALASTGTRSPVAYAAYLQARGYLHTYDKPGNIDLAIASLRDAVAADPNFAAGHAALGYAYWRKYDDTKETQWIEPARESCQRALAADSSSPDAHICLGTLFNATGKYESAVTEFRQAVSLEPSNADGYHGLAQSYEGEGNAVEAEKSFKKCIEVRPNYWGGYNWLGGFYFRSGRYSEATAMFQRITQLDPNNSRGYYNLGGVYVAEGKYEDAINTLQKGIAIAPSFGAYANLATAYFYLRQFDKAAASYEQAVQLNDHNFELWGDVGEAYYWVPGKRDLSRNAYSKAIAYAREQLDVNPRDTNVLSALGWYNAMLGDNTAARRYMDRAVAIAPTNADVCLRDAIVRAQAGDRDGAVHSLQKGFANGVTPSMVRNNPIFDSLLSDARLKKLLDNSAGK